MTLTIDYVWLLFLTNLDPASYAPIAIYKWPKNATLYVLFSQALKLYVFSFTQNDYPSICNIIQSKKHERSLNKKHISNKIKWHTNKHPGKPIYFPYSKKQSPDQTKSRAHQIMFRWERNSNIGEGLVTSLHP